MASPRKIASQAAIATSKGKSMAVGGAGPTGTHPSHIDIHIEDIREEHSYLATAPEEGTNGHKTQLPVEGQLLQILANL